MNVSIYLSIPTKSTCAEKYVALACRPIASYTQVIGSKPVTRRPGICCRPTLFIEQKKNNEH